jgi:hypothetical protein
MYDCLDVKFDYILVVVISVSLKSFTRCITVEESWPGCTVYLMVINILDCTVLIKYSFLLDSLINLSLYCFLIIHRFILYNFF